MNGLSEEKGIDNVGAVDVSELQSAYEALLF